jgi:membrane associated rhomboid family serine protease
VLIIPYQTRFTARSLPVVTLALIVVNALVYFVFQAGDRQALQQATAYYFGSQLPAIELPRYAAALEQRGDPRAAAVARALEAPRGQPPLAVLSAMQRDRDFMRDLENGVVVPPSDPVHRAWREQRERFDALLKVAVTERYALQRGGSPVQLLTYQFLHGDAMHWFGNMLVLLLAGPFAEAALGRRRFLLAYLLGGVAAGALFLALNGQGLVGASGAIAAAMAMVAVLYGLRKVPVFYWVFVYFNTARVPALLLLPVWLVVEAVQWALAPESRVAYSAHIGGFLAGALAAWALRARNRPAIERSIDAQLATDGDSEGTGALLQKAQQAASRLDTARAARAFADLLAREPEHAGHATAYFNMALLGRHSGLLLDAARRALSVQTAAARTELRPLYLKMSQPDVLAGLPADEQLRLARRLAAAREDAAALHVLDAVAAAGQAPAGAVESCLTNLYRAYARQGQDALAEEIRRRLAASGQTAERCITSR